MVLLLSMLLAATTAPAPSALPLTELPPQVLAPGECALVLWERSSRRRIAMAIARPATLRISQDAVRSLAQTHAEGTAISGFTPTATYADAALTVEFALAITPGDGGGAIIRDGTITVTTPDGGAVVSPVAGLIGCQP